MSAVYHFEDVSDISTENTSEYVIFMFLTREQFSNYTVLIYRILSLKILKCIPKMLCQKCVCLDNLGILMTYLNHIFYSYCTMPNIIW